MVKTIAIIGAGGAMGKWFSEYFSKKGFEVTGFDITNPVAKNIKNAKSLVSAILNVDYVLLSTPTKKTPEIIRLIAKEMKRESYLIDITSQKLKTATALGKIPSKSFTYLHTSYVWTRCKKFKKSEYYFSTN